MEARKPPSDVSGVPTDKTARDQDDFTPMPDELSPVPDELAFLVEPAKHYGRKYQFDDAIQWFLENGEESDFETLSALAERARLSQSYARYTEWADEVSLALARSLYEHYPSKIAPPPSGVEEPIEDRRKRLSAEASDPSELGKRRREAGMRQMTKANDIVHDMDIYFLFILMDACDFDFE